MGRSSEDIMDTEAMAPINKDTKIVIVGAGVFGLSTAKQLALEGHHDVLVLDRHTPPVR